MRRLLLVLLVCGSCFGQAVTPGSGGGGGTTLPNNLTGVATNGSGAAQQQTSANVVSMFAGGGCVGFLKNDGTCVVIASGYAHVVTPVAEWAFPAGATSLVTEPDVQGNFPATFAGTGISRIPSGGILMNSTGRLTTTMTTWSSAIIRACPYVYPIGVQVGANFEGLWGSSVSGQGVNILDDRQTVTTYVHSPSLYDTNFTTSAGDVAGGCHTYAFTLGGGPASDTLGHIYKDGVEVGSYITQGTPLSSPTLTGGAIYGLGSAKGFTSSFDYKGSILYAEIYSSILTPAQVVSETAYTNGRSGSDPYTVQTPTSTTPTVTALGDSITCCNLIAAQDYPALFSLNNTYTVINQGSANDLAAAMAATQQYRTLGVNSPNAGQNVYSIFGGTNDIATNNTPTFTYGQILKAVQTAKLAGLRPFVWTMLDRQSLQTGKNALNTLIRSGAVVNGYYLVDGAQNALLGADGASTNTTYFQADLIHPTAAGQVLLAAAGSAAINSADGSTANNPTITAVQNFTGTAATNYVIQTPTLAATHALTSCLYLTGAQYARTIVNGSATLTITVSSASTITGSTAIAPNSTAVFTPQLTAATTGGCSWLRTQ